MLERSSQDRRKSELHILCEVANVLNDPFEPSELIESVMGIIGKMLDPTEAGMILLWDLSKELLRPQAASGQGISDLGALRKIGLREGESIAGKIYAEGTALLLNSPKKIRSEQANMQPANRLIMKRAFGSDALPQSIVAAPLCAGGQKLGVIIFRTIQGSKAFSESDVPFVQALADVIALLIGCARMHDEVKSIRDVQNLDQLRSEVMATLSHELRTPLAAIKGYSTALLLEEVEWSDDKSRAFLHMIDEECDDLQTMITDILDAAIIEVGQLALEYQPVRLEHLAYEVVDEISRRTKNHHYVVDFPPKFPIVDVDPRRIRQVLRNILDNAAKYSPDGGLVMISGKVRPSDVVVSIADQGVGISPEDLIPLFDKYFRVKAPTGYYVPGTGLGLPVAREIIEAHGGKIWAESKAGEGTVIGFSIPREGLSTEIEEEHA